MHSLIDNGAVESEDCEVEGDTCRYWVATNEAAEFTIPDNLQSLLSARLDRLENATRNTLQMASVIGRSFYHRILQAVYQDNPVLDKHVNTLLQPREQVMNLPSKNMRRSWRNWQLGINISHTSL